MKRFVVCLLFVAVTMLGCSQNHFNIPTENFAEKVRVIGVAPILIDADSDINYPQKDLLIPLIADLNRKYEPLLIRKLQSTGNFYAVSPLADDPQKLFSRLVARREKRDDAGVQYNKYFWKNDEVVAYIKKNRLDSVMLIVVNGLSKNSKIYSSNLLTSLETNYNYLMITAQIIGPDGTVLWEYPNFRARLLTYYPLVNLQYPDFSESEANLSKETAVRFKSIDGIRRTLEQKKNDWLLRETQEPEVYGKLFDEMTSLIKHDSDKQKNSTSTVDDKVKPASPDMPTKPVAPAAEAPAQPAAPNSAVKITESPAAAPNEIVPATNSTR
ncbi:MAG: hypothetical protein PHG09_13985 [Desulfuromonadaceae bacterium]|nr:hypothetical protein [Desulfuromonadaceae bacterium]MDD4131633.1 hypothetical protein [Desulfuromonadaceae bacterium]